jgi:L-aspartate oxidase
VRGEGAVLLDEDGRRFMLDAHPDAELAPRDVVARGIAAAMARQGGRPVMLDATALGGDFLAQRFPGITRVLTQHGLDWAREPIPVTPAAHYWMGGIRTDIDGRTTLPGLYAVGEASCTGVHGANRLASNSLLESLVFAWRAADALDGEQFPLDLQGVIGVPPAQSAPIGVATRQFVRDDFQELMWTRVGLERDAEGLRAAIHELDSLQVEGEQVDDYEDRALLELGRLVARAALAREESRGAHSRRDFPDTIETYAHPIRWRLSSPVPSELSLSDAELLDRDPLLTGPITTTGFSVGLRAEAAS